MFPNPSTPRPLPAPNLGPPGRSAPACGGALRRHHGKRASGRASERAADAD